MGSKPSYLIYMLEPETLNANYELLCVLLTFQSVLGLFKISMALSFF